MAKVKRLIGGALRDEHSARLYYTKLIHSTKDPKIKKVIREIRGDEIDHFRILTKLKKRKK